MFCCHYGFDRSAYDWAFPGCQHVEVVLGVWESKRAIFNDGSADLSPHVWFEGRVLVLCDWAWESCALHLGEESGTLPLGVEAELIIVQLACRLFFFAYGVLASGSLP